MSRFEIITVTLMAFVILILAFVAAVHSFQIISIHETLKQQSTSHPKQDPS